MKTVFFPGSFNPFTVGHADIVRRALGFADKVVIGIGTNADKTIAANEENDNLKTIESLYSRSPYSDSVEVTEYTGLTAEAALSCGADCIIRGVRNATDFDYEYGLACANREVFGIETILLPADPALNFVCSSLIRDLDRAGRRDLASMFLPSKNNDIK